MLRFVSFALSLTIGLVCLAGVSFAEERPAAVTDPKLADADFAIQGEYLGESIDHCGYWSLIGLQVFAQGDGEFQAMEYRGGLPGHGWDCQTRTPFTGKRTEQGVTLASKCRTYSQAKGGAGEFKTTGCWPSSLRKIERQSATLGARPPSDARVLFDGSSLSEFNKAKLTDDGLLMVGTETALDYGDFTMHLEFRTPYSPKARGQGRGNSGIYIQGRYELQILDSFGLEGLPNECGGLYKTRAPDVNMCLPPLAWQTYDITFQSARFCGTQKVCPARISAWHNGVTVHQQVEIPGPTGAGQPETPDPKPIKLQDHGNPIHFRNVWIVDRTAR